MNAAFNVARQTAENFGESFKRVKDENSIESILSGAAKSRDPNQLQGAIGQILSQVSPERQGNAIKYLEGVYNTIISRQQQDQTAQAYEQAGMKGEQFFPPQIQKQRLKNQQPSPAQLKSSEKEKEEQGIRSVAQDSFNGLVGLLNRGNIGRGAGLISKLPFAFDTQKDVGEFNALSGGLESMLVDMVSRGTLSNSRFQYITETLLPKPDDAYETINGKLKGLAKILNLDVSSLTGKRKAKSKEGPSGNGDRPGLDAFLGEQ